MLSAQLTAVGEANAGGAPITQNDLLASIP